MEKKNMWAAKYLDNITPELTLAEMAYKDKRIKGYLASAVNKNEAFDKGIMALKLMEYVFSGDSQKAWVKAGELTGSTFASTSFLWLG
jgi:hypothetical protein